MCKQLWMGMEPQPLHNGMVCSPTATQAFSLIERGGGVTTDAGRWTADGGRPIG